jgi:hypothetical protein
MFRFLHGLERAFCRRALANTLICGVLYFTLAVGVNGVSESWNEATSYWPAAGLALVGFLLRGPVLIPGIALANAASGAYLGVSTWPDVFWVGAGAGVLGWLGADELLKVGLAW